MDRKDQWINQFYRIPPIWGCSQLLKLQASIWYSNIGTGFVFRAKRPIDLEGKIKKERRATSSSTNVQLTTETNIAPMKVAAKTFQRITIVFIKLLPFCCFSSILNEPIKLQLSIKWYTRFVLVNSTNTDHDDLLSSMSTSNFSTNADLTECHVPSV